MGSTWAALFWFKFIGFVAYMTILIVIWKKTKNLSRVAFFAFNPLVLSEILVNGHNDAVMMALALLGIYFIEAEYTSEDLGIRNSWCIRIDKGCNGRVASGSFLYAMVSEISIYFVCRMYAYGIFTHTTSGRDVSVVRRMVYGVFTVHRWQNRR